MENKYLSIYMYLSIKQILEVPCVLSPGIVFQRQVALLGSSPIQEVLS